MMTMTSSLEDLGLYSIRVQSVVWFHWQNEKVTIGIER